MFMILRMNVMLVILLFLLSVNLLVRVRFLLLWSVRLVNGWVRRLGFFYWSLRLLFNVGFLRV